MQNAECRMQNADLTGSVASVLSCCSQARDEYRGQCFTLLTDRRAVGSVFSKFRQVVEPDASFANLLQANLHLVNEIAPGLCGPRLGVVRTGRQRGANELGHDVSVHLVTPDTAQTAAHTHAESLNPQLQFVDLPNALRHARTIRRALHLAIIVAT